MKIGVYAVKDFRNGFMTPSFESNDATAMRNFGNACLQERTVINNFSEDFELFKLGEYDSELGLFDVIAPTPICKATDFVKRKENA